MEPLPPFGAAARGREHLREREGGELRAHDPRIQTGRVQHPHNRSRRGAGDLHDLDLAPFLELFQRLGGGDEGEDLGSASLKRQLDLEGLLHGLLPPTGTSCPWTAVSKLPPAYTPGTTAPRGASAWRQAPCGALRPRLSSEPRMPMSCSIVVKF